MSRALYSKKDLPYLAGFFLLFAALSLSLNLWAGNISIDDSFIFYRYAQNLADGHGFVYNPGGERVEGFTSFLWTIVLALVSKAGLDLDLWARILGSVFGLLNGMLSMRICRIVGARPWFAALAVIANLGFMLWNSATGMDFSLYSVLLTFFCLAVLSRRFVPLVSASLLLPLARPEGLAFVAAGYLFLLVTPGEGRGRKGRILLAGACSLALISLYAYLKFRYFGYPFPNTFYAKVGGTSIQAAARGLDYIFRFSVRFSPFLLILLLAGAASVRRGLWNDPRAMGVAFLAAVVGLNLAIYIVTGGDHFGSFRHLQYTYPVTTVLFSLSLERLSDLWTRPGKTRWVLAAVFWIGLGFAVWLRWAKESGIPADVVFVDRIALALSALCVLGLAVFFARIGRAMGLLEAILLLGLAFQPCLFVQQEFVLADRSKIVGEYLREKTPKETRIGVLLAGSTPFYAHRFCIDLLGLNDLRIAHATKSPVFHARPKNHGTFNKAFFYLYDPDLFIVWIEDHARLLCGDLFEEERFRERYEKIVLAPTRSVRVDAFLKRGYPLLADEGAKDPSR